MLSAVVIGPLLIVLIARFGFEALDGLLYAELGFSLDAYRSIAASLLMLIPPMLTGMMCGFLMLDERDEHVIAYYSVTPLTRSGYVSYRLFLPTLLSGFFTLLFLLASGITKADVRVFPAVLMLVLEAPLFALTLCAFAVNKVEGLAISKLAGVVLLVPFAAAFVPEPWSYIAGVFPTYWPSRIYMGLAEGSVASVQYGFDFIAGMLLHGGLLLYCLRRFLRRTD